MKKKGRILAFVLAMVMMLTEVSTAWAASENVQDYSTEAEESDSEESKEGQGASLNASAEGEGSVGSLLADDLQKEFTRTQAEAYINGLTVEGQTVTVSYLTNMKADLVAGIFTEDGKQLLASGHVSVEPSDQTSVQITLSDMPPQYFRASAYLLDPETREPICEAYNSQYYTKDIQDLISKTSEDFEDTGRLVYLDTGVVENQNQNFAVYNEGTVVFDENGKTDILTKNADGTWTFANASAKAKALKAGDVIAYNYKDGLMDAVRVKKVDKKGNTVIVTPEDEIRLEDIFEHLKIHSDGGMKVKGVDTSGMSEYLTYRGLTDGDTEEISVQSEDTDVSVESVADMMGTPTAKLDISGKYSTWSFKGNLKLSFESAAVDVALSWKSSYIQVYMDWNLIYSLTFEGTTDGEWEWNMMELTFSPVVGCYIVVTPAICIEVSGSIDVSGKLLGGRIGIMYDGSRNDISRGPTLEKMKLQASIFIGMKFKVAVTILDKIEKLKSELSISVKVGGEFAVSDTIPLDSGKGKTKHTCKQCLSIKIKLKLSVTLKLDVINDAVKTQVTLTTISKDMGTFFYSLDYSGLGEGACPHYLYKTSFVTVNRKADEVEEKRVQDANVSIKLLKEKEECDGKATKNEWSDSVQMTTDENGECSTLLAPGDYEAVFDKDSLTATVKFTVADECEEHKVLMEERVYSITYNIKDQKGIAQRGAEVTATDSKGEKQKVTADGSGKANLQLKGGAYDIEIHNGDLEKKFRTKVSRNLEMDIKLHGPAYKVTVTVTDESGNPVSDAGIAGLNSEKENVLDDSAVTGTDGKAEIYLENGDYTLQVTKTKGNLGGEASVTVNGEEQEVSIVIYGKRTITVVVEDESGNPLENAGVVAVNGDKRYDGISDKNGKAELVLGRGTWELTGTKDELKGSGSVTVEGEDKSVSLRLYQPEYNVNIKITGAVANRYAIYSEDGYLLKKAYISYLDKEYYIKEKLKAGRYCIEIIDKGTAEWIQVEGDINRSMYVAETDIKCTVEEHTLYVNGGGFLDAKKILADYANNDITRIVLGEGIEVVGWEKEYGYIYDGKLAAANKKVTEIVFSSSLRVIHENAFRTFEGLKNVDIPSGVVYIDEGNFRYAVMDKVILRSSYARVELFNGRTKNLIIDARNVKGDYIGINAENVVFTDNVKEQHISVSELAETVTYGSGITELSASCLSGCTKLKEVNLPENITVLPKLVFSGCTALEMVRIPEKVQEIGASAFSGCTSLKTIRIPEKVKEIKASAFSGCTSLTEVNLSANLEAVGDEAFLRCSSLESITIPDKTVRLGNSVFKECSALSQVNLSESLYSIGTEAFSYCTSLENVVLPDSLRILESNEKGEAKTFAYSGLTEMVIPATVRQTGTKMFEKCSSLTKLSVLGGDNSGLVAAAYKQGIPYYKLEELTLNIPEVEVYSEYAPYLKKFVLGERVEKVADKSWTNTYCSGDELKGDWNKLEEVVFPKHLKYLGDTDFSYLKNLKELNMPEKIDECPGTLKSARSVTRLVVSEGIEEITYGGSGVLQTAVLPKSLKKIKQYAFSDCTSLTEVTFAENSELTTIGVGAFENCTSLKEIILGDKVEWIGGNTFKNSGLVSAVIPSGISDGDEKCLKISAVFGGSTKLQNLTLGSESVDLSDYESDSYSGVMAGLKRVVLLDSVKTIVRGYNCRAEEIVLSNSITQLNEETFKYCLNLKKITLPVGLTEIPERLFSDCEKLEEVQSGDKIQKIGSYAFASCWNLEKFEFPDSLISIGSHAFVGCSKLKEIELPEGLKTIGEYAFSNVETVAIPSSVSSIGNFAFSNTALKMICFKALKRNQLYRNMPKILRCFGQWGDSTSDYDNYYEHNFLKENEEFMSSLKATNKKILVYYPADEAVSEADKENMNLQFCTWIPYTGSLDDAETFLTSEEFQTVEGTEIFSDGNSETGTGTIESDAEEQTQPEEVIIFDEEENIESGSSETGDSEEISVEEEFDDSEEISVEEEFDDGDELVIHEFEKPVSEAAENFTSGSAVLELNEAGEVVSGVTQTQTYTGIVENSRCFFVVVRDKNAEDFFADSNLLFMTQAVSDEDGNLTVEYRTEGNTGIPILYGQEKSLDISDAEIIVEDGMIYTGKEQKPEVTVVCGGETLTENKDYVLKGDVAATDAGTYKIRVVGRNPYRGSAEKEYQVAKAKQKISLGMMTRELTAGSKVNLKAAGIGTISYTSRQPDIVSADTNGVLTAKKAGVAAVVIQASGNKNYASARKNVIVFVKKGTGNSGNTGGSGGTAQKPTVKKSVMKLNASSLVLQKKQKTSALVVSGMVSGDYVKSVVSGNKKLVKVVNFTKSGKIILQAQKKTGKATLTIQLARGAKKTIKIKVQAGKVKTSKISISKKVRIKKGKKFTLKPALTPITSQEKVIFTSSNKKIATVTSKGVIKAKKPGKAKITVRSGRKKVTVTVTVTK